MKLGLGTVQFGLPYGLTHGGGPTRQDEIARMLAAAAHAGVDCLDTAALYGESEERLGLALSGRSFRIVTKTPAFDDDVARSGAQALREAFSRSLERLRQTRLYGLLVHHAGDVLRPGAGALLAALGELKREGLVEKVGVSVYTPRELERVLTVFEPDIVQLPLNVLDQRFLNTGCLALLRSRGIEVHARSIFLQGLLLTEAGAAHAFFAPLAGTLEDYASELRARGLTKLDGALEFVRRVPFVDYAIVGAQSAAELAAILDSARARHDDVPDFARFAVDDEDMILPPRWRLH